MFEGKSCSHFRAFTTAACKISDVTIKGNQVVITSVCASGQENVGTTTYHGDRFETVNTNGTTSHATWVGPCK